VTPLLTLYKINTNNMLHNSYWQFNISQQRQHQISLRLNVEK